MAGATLISAREPQIVAWFREANRPALAYGSLAIAAIGYSVGVAYVLSLAGALPMPEPYIRIPDETYFFWGTFFYAPVIVAAWLIATGLMQVLGRAFGSRSNIDDLLQGTALATGIGTLATLLPDLVTSPLRALGVINELAWEQSIAEHDGWFVFVWAAMLAYVALFLIAYPLAVRQATHLTWWKATITGVIGFLAFQGFEFIFIRSATAQRPEIVCTRRLGASGLEEDQ
jgi:hypothetical protein